MYVTSQPIRAAIALVAVPWDAFVAAFLFYTLLTLVVLGGADLSSPFMAAAYLAVPVAYVLVILARLARAMGHLAGQATLPTATDSGLLLH